MALHVRRAGADPPAPRGTILFLHGFPFDGSIWEPQLAALPDGWRGLAPDLRGFGRSDMDDRHAVLPTGKRTRGRIARESEHVLTIRLLADDMARLIEAEAEAPVVVCGLSMGGYVAFELWRCRPELIRALVLADTRAEPDSDEGREARMRMAQTARDDGARPIAAAMLPSLLAPTTRDRQPDVVDHVRSMILDTPPTTIIAALAGMAARRDSSRGLKSIHVPTLVVAGDQDAIIHTDTARALADDIPGARLAIISDAGHLPNVENPDAFNASLNGFLDSL